LESFGGRGHVAVHHPDDKKLRFLMLKLSFEALQRPLKASIVIQMDGCSSESAPERQYDCKAAGRAPPFTFSRYLGENQTDRAAPPSQRIIAPVM
jgi:hypothetical protein